MTFGARLGQARKDKRLTQEQLGKGLGTDGKDVTKAVVSGWENDLHAPRADQLAMMCDRLGCSADYLLFGAANEANLSPEVTFLAAAVDTLPHGRPREWVLMTIREAIKIAREMPIDDTAHNEDTRKQKRSA